MEFMLDNLLGVIIKFKNLENNTIKYKQIKNLSSKSDSVICNEDIILSILEGEDIEADFVLRDRDDDEIPLNILSEIVRQYSNCACFCVKICPVIQKVFDSVGDLRKQDAAGGSSVVIYKEGLESYIRASQSAFILEEYSRSNSLKDSSRRTLVTLGTEYLRSMCGNYPSKEAKLACAKAIIAIFPCYRIEDSKIGGCVSTSFLCVHLCIKNFQN
ncbi:uncharacterized protein LOC129940416 [Eupeodes corollae]|uniref:uncharacterized protein LOC129940416 n=1 Tax=Eupeodes corollae TaxID=290404 RepID=UPI0024907D13|nr:uncharacterized protein LOC129940416 [Eupeodes corollae]